MPQPISQAPAPAPAPAPTAPTPSVLDSLGTAASSTFKSKNVLGLMLASALASGGIGGLLTARTPKRSGETPNERRLRILKNALGAGAAGAGVVGAGALAKNMFESAPEIPGVTGQVSSVLRDPLTRTLSIVGGAGFGNRIGASMDKKQALNEIMRALNAAGGKLTPSDFFGSMQTAGKDIAGATAERARVLDTLREKLNLSDDGVEKLMRTAGVSPVSAPVSATGPAVPKAENALVSAFKRNLNPSIGASSGRLTNNKLVNRRFWGGVLGGGAGASLPYVWDLGRLIADRGLDAAGKTLADS